MRALRRRLENSEALIGLVGGLVGRYLALCNGRIRWQTEGLSDLRAALADGPVLLVMWHESLLMGSLHWPVDAGPVSSLHDQSPIARAAGAMQRRIGLQPVEMSAKRSNAAASREVLRRVRAGTSIGITGDGPLGPARVMNTAPLEWARITGLPIYCYGFATTSGRRLGSWDRLRLPYPKGKGAMVFARFPGKIARKATSQELATAQKELGAFLTATADRCETLLKG